MSRAAKKSNARKTSSNNHCHAIEIPARVPALALKNISPITNTQREVFNVYESNRNLWLGGSAGTGKTFLATYLALRELDKSDVYEKIIFVRSVVPTRDLGALPGTLEEKSAWAEAPFSAICAELYGDSKAYQKLKGMGTVEFCSTSFLRGITMRNAIVIVDEAQNCNFHELDTSITRLDSTTKIIYCGDEAQSDLSKLSEKEGYVQFRRIIERMKSFDMISFSPKDIVRGPVVKEYLTIKSK